MNIGIIGAGRMAGALGVNFAKAGNQLAVGARNSEAAAALPQKLEGGTAHRDIANAARIGKVILLAVKRSGITEALAAAGADPSTVVNLVDDTSETAPTLTAGLSLPCDRRHQ